MDLVIWIANIRAFSSGLYEYDVYIQFSYNFTEYRTLDLMLVHFFFLPLQGFFFVSLCVFIVFVKRGGGWQRRKKNRFSQSAIATAFLPFCMRRHLAGRAAITSTAICELGQIFFSCRHHIQFQFFLSQHSQLTRGIKITTEKKTRPFVG